MVDLEMFSLTRTSSATATPHRAAAPQAPMTSFRDFMTFRLL